jgi:adenosylcobinamide-GDP ribazoletransferase
VPVVAAVASLLACGVVVGFAGHGMGSAWNLLAGLVVTVGVVLALLLRCVRRLGGITGDVLGAAVEVSFAVLVLAAATA